MPPFAFGVVAALRVPEQDGMGFEAPCARPWRNVGKESGLGIARVVRERTVNADGGSAIHIEQAHAGALVRTDQCAAVGESPCSGNRQCTLNAA